jgi:outer membrane protein OmpA-like peptidoglycan-associated protein
MRKIIAVQFAVLLTTACVSGHPQQPPPSIIFAEPINVFFDVDSASLTDDARAVIPEAIKRAKRFDCQNLQVTGHTDGTGSENGNAPLSLQRADIVKGELLRDGYKDPISAIGQGSRYPFKPNEVDKPEPLNRRAQINFGCRNR